MKIRCVTEQTIEELIVQEAQAIASNDDPEHRSRAMERMLILVNLKNNVQEFEVLEPRSKS